MNIKRRIQQLETKSPIVGPSFRTIFRHGYEGEVVVDPPLGAEEKLLVVTFVRPTS